MDISVIGVLEDEDILLDVAALALSQLDHAECDVNAYLKQLEEIEDRVCQEGRSAFLSSERVIGPCAAAGRFTRRPWMRPPESGSARS